MSTPREQLLHLVDYVRGFRAVYLVAAGLRLGLFRAIAETPGSSPDALAARLGLEPRAVGVWCRTACSLGLLDADESGALGLPPGLGPVLADPSSPWYYGGAIGLAVEHEARDLAELDHLVRTGRTVPFQARGRKFSEQVAAATAGLHILVARKVLPELPAIGERLAQGLSLLDVGCGCGGFLIALARAYPAGRYVGVDIDRYALATARRAAKAAGVARAVRFRTARADGFGIDGTFEVVTLLQALHEIRPQLRPGILGECARRLGEGGWLVILDETYPSTWADLRRPEYNRPVLTALAELGWGTVMPTREEQEALLTQAGLAVKARALVGDGFTLLTAQRA